MYHILIRQLFPKHLAEILVPVLFTGRETDDTSRVAFFVPQILEFFFRVSDFAADDISTHDVLSWNGSYRVEPRERSGHKFRNSRPNESADT